jgi:hypothetical protein
MNAIESVKNTDLHKILTYMSWKEAVRTFEKAVADDQEKIRKL